MGLHEMPLSMSPFGLRMGIMSTNFHMCGIMLLLGAVFKILVRNASPRGHMCLKCRMFNLSGPCELYYLLDLSCSGCDLISMYFMCCSVN